MSSPAGDPDGLVAAARDGSVRAVARLITMVEHGGDRAAAVAMATAGLDRAAAVVGLTGPPGVGKSTTTGRLIAVARARDQRVAVLAVDPSSPFSGGALLGDRVRMADHATDPGVYIRSMSSRGHLGGLSAAAPGAVDLLSALGFDLVLVETVGVGQNEVDVMRLADTVVVVLAPGMGDGVQAAKAGILEIADILVVNKSDREGAAVTARELKAAVALGRAGEAGPGEWRVPVLPMIATEPGSGSGLPELAEALERHADHLGRTRDGGARRRRRALATVQAVVLETVETALGSADGRATLAAAADAVAAGELDHRSASADVIAWLMARIGAGC